MPLILEINNDCNLAKAAAEAVANHYSQEIHLTDNSNETMPYFDPLHGRPRTLTQITKHWTDKLQQSAHDNDNISFLNIGSSLIGTYDKCIRVKCFSSSKNNQKMYLEPTCYIVLIQFEQLLSSYLAIDQETPAKIVLDFPSTKRTEIVNSIYSSIEAVVLDIFSLTALQKISMRSNSKHCQTVPSELISNTIMPTLLRILEHCVSLQRYLLSQTQTQNMLKTEFEQHKYLLTITTLAALSFCSDEPFKYESDQSNSINLTSSNLDASEILPQNWLKELTLRHIFFDKSSYPPSTLADDDDGFCTNSYLDGLLESIGLTTREDITFMEDIVVDVKNTSATLSMPWLDHTKGIGVRAARSLLRSLGTLALSLECCTRNLGKDMNIQTDISDKVSILKIITRVAGEDYVVQTARESFFGRLDLFKKSKLSDQNRNSEIILKVTTPSQSTKFNGIPQTRPMADHVEAIESFTRPTLKGNWKHAEDEIYTDIPARIPSTFRLLAALKFPAVTSTVWDNALPIIFTLIDSCTESHQSLGAALLLLFLNESTPTSIMSKGRAQSIEQVLSIACRACNSAVPLALLSKARCRLFENLPPNKESTKAIQDAVISSFNWVQKNVYCGPGGESEKIDKISGLLIGSIQPLLEQLAQLPDAMATELGRSGLSTLLPLIRWDSKTNAGKIVQIASIGCLISLMLGAYPMMERHGGKIMSELAACVFRSQRDMEIHAKISARAKGSFFEQDIKDCKETIGTRILILASSHAASIALVICGSRADAILSKIEKGNFPISSKKWCKLVRSGALAMTNNWIEIKQSSRKFHKHM